MTLEGGSQIGPYTIEREIGRGGMGVVYLARDSRLDRDVAIKSLPEHLASDPERLARFEREARTLATLSHPNVAGIYGVEEQDGAKYLILEYVEGETLEEALHRGHLRVDDALEYAGQIASGVEAAHEAGVVHRDLKPANIKITPDRRVKVLDFGLARTCATPGSDVALSQSPTMITQGGDTRTGGGVILGTASYMSPEQARGHYVDRRTDIWSFGVVLYEMLCGEPPFRCSTLSETIGAVLHVDIDFDRLGRDVPESLAELLRRCLERDVSERKQSIGDVRVDLARVRNHVGSVERGGRVERGSRGALGWFMAMLMGVVLLWSLGLRPTGTLDRNGLLTRWVVTLPEMSRVALRGIGGKYDYARLVDVSNDGAVAFVRRDGDGEAYLYMKSPGSHQPSRVEGTEGARGVFFAPDGRWVAYLSDTALMKVSLDGGMPQLVCHVDSTGGFDGTWSPDQSRIVFATDEGLFRVDALGGDAVLLVEPDASAGERGIVSPRFSLDGEGVFFTIVMTPQTHVVYLSLDDLEWDVVVRDATQAVEIEGERILFARDGELLLAPIDPSSKIQIGSAVSVMDGIHTLPGVGGYVLTQFSVSGSGHLVYLPHAETESLDRLVELSLEENGETRERVLVEGAGTWVHPRFSPDETRVSLDIHTPDGMRDVYIYDIERGHMSRVSHNGMTWESEWSRDGERLALMSAEQAGRWGVFVTASDLSTPLREVVAGNHLIPNDWLGGDEGVLYYDNGGEHGVHRVLLMPEIQVEEILADQHRERFPRLSPNGEWLAYVSDESGAREVYVRSYPSMGSKYRISSHEGGEPVWSDDGRTLFYREGDRFLAVDVEYEPSFRASNSRVLFSGPYDEALLGHQHFDVSSDGRRFLMVRHASQTGPSEVRVVMNWQAALGQ